MIKKMLLEYIGGPLRQLLFQTDAALLKDIEEIRIRIAKPLLLKKGAKEIYLSPKGQAVTNIKDAYFPVLEDISLTLELLCGYSLYAHEEDMKHGFLTIEGGHRIGLCGKVAAKEGKIGLFQNISSLNFRIAHEKIDCAADVLPFLTKKDKLLNTLILSPPGCGKTTLLRDLIRLCSLRGETVGVVDERSEIGGCYKGVSQMDLGPRTDILDCCPKAEGMKMLLRSMAPQIIAVDEIGGQKDIEAIDEILFSGIKLLSTIHGYSLEDLQKKPFFQELLHKNIFERFVILSAKGGPGFIEGVYNNAFEKIGQGEESI